jgi:hypothetical protein
VLSLRELQGAFWDAVARAPGEFDGGACDPRLLDLIAPSVSLAPAERLRVYAEMYFWRLVDALREDYPRVSALLGEHAWRALVRDYLVRHPSADPSLRHAGGALAEFIAATSGPAAPPWLAALARLEWARVEAFDAPDARPLRLADLRAVPPEDWPRLRFALAPACAVLVEDWPVDRLWKDDAETAGAAPERVALRIWRDDFRVYHARMDATEERLFSQLAAGATFATLCEELDDPEDAGARLLAWLDAGILADATVV